MVDQPQEYAPTSADAEASRRRRSFMSVLVAIVVIVLIVLGLLMLRSCTTAKAEATLESDSKTIESVEGLDPQPGAVSVWVGEDADINALLTSADVRSTDVVNMGGSRYVISVPKGDETAVAGRLMKVRGVIDAGLVYATDEGR